MWQSDHHNANATDQFGIGVAEDASGNIYVCGSSTNSAIFSGSDSDYLIVKYNSQGVEQWARTYNGSDDGEDVAVAIAVSSGGDVFVTGISEDNSSGYDFATIKYNSSGTQQWVQRYDRQNLEDVAVWIGTDIFGNAYVTGASGTSTNDWDIATLVYTSNGVKINEQVYTNVGTGYDRPTDMGFDNQGNIYITGTSSVDGIDYDIVTLKLNSRS